MATRRKAASAKHDGHMMDTDGSDDESKNETSDKRGEWNVYSSSQPMQQDQPLSLSKADGQAMLSTSLPSSPLDPGSSPPLEIASNPEETSSNGNKDDDDDNDDDDNDDEKIDSHYDPERLKAFNMFVRLFVDENLDRMVPISKQPKEKIQAIIDACTRQFPEFEERNRKRIRTYLKSCRRYKRTRDNGWENSRPTPPHLTSIQAEQILAAACENESQNAKRMRMGMEPLPQPNPLLQQQSNASVQHHDKPLVIDSSPNSKADTNSGSHSNSALAKALERPVVSDPKSLNGGPVFQNNFQSFQQKSSCAMTSASSGVGLLASACSAVSANSVPPHSSVSSSVSASQPITNGPTDLSLKTLTKPRPTLNAVEVAAVRQLITGYRESAAFLLRSAEELENLLIQQTSNN